MALKSLSLLFLDTDRPEVSAATTYAIALAERFQAHLTVALGVSPIIVPSSIVAAEMASFAEEEHVERRETMTTAALNIRAAASLRGVATETHVFSKPYDPILPHLVQVARVSDLAVIEVAGASTAAQDLVIEILMASGVPALLVPKGWSDHGPLALAIIAWDASAPAARAIQGAMPLLAQAEKVEIVSVHGEKVLPGQAEGGELARHLARHCKAVESIDLPVQGGNVAQTIREHGRMERAGLIVMGAYGHSRMREFILGGVTRDTLRDLQVPTVMTH